MKTLKYMNEEIFIFSSIMLGQLIIKRRVQHNSLILSINLNGDTKVSQGIKIK